MPRKIDNCQPRIVQELRDLGVSVAITSNVGKGFVDTVWGWRGNTYIVELKDRDIPLTPAQVKFQQGWHGSLAMLRDMGGGYMLTVWRDGLHIITVQLGDMQAVLETLEATE